VRWKRGEIRVIILFAIMCADSCHILREKTVRPANVPSRTTVCAIAADPRRFYDKRVTVKGCVSTDGIERTVLIDDACPYTGIRPSQTARLRPNQRFESIFGNEICGTFTGTFRSSVSFENIVVDTNVLEIDETANLKTRKAAR
jgi:hypothetical protein